MCTSIAPPAAAGGAIPLRDPAAVAHDVANEKVSTGAARARYGVVIGDDGLLDLAATTALRERRDA